MNQELDAPEAALAADPADVLHPAAAAPAPRSLGANQADGLRAMFGSDDDGDDPLVVCIASALAPESTATLGLGLAHALRRRGHTTLLVDEVPLAQRPGGRGFPYPVRYDLGQVFTGAIGLDRALRKVDEGLWFAAGTKLRQAVERKQVRLPPLTALLRHSGQHFGYVVVATGDPFGPALSCYGPSIERIVVTSPDEAAMARALLHVRALSVTQGGAPVPVLVVGGDDAAAGQACFAALEAAARTHLDQPLIPLGWVRAAQATVFGDPTDAGLALPVSLYQLLADRVAAGVAA